MRARTQVPPVLAEPIQSSRICLVHAWCRTGEPMLVHSRPAVTTSRLPQIAPAAQAHCSHFSCSFLKLFNFIKPLVDNSSGSSGSSIEPPKESFDNQRVENRDAQCDVENASLRDRVLVHDGGREEVCQVGPLRQAAIGRAELAPR